MSEVTSIFNRLSDLTYSDAPALKLPTKVVSRIAKRIDAENQKELSRTIHKPDHIETHYANHCT